MNLFALSFALETGGQIALAALLGVAGFFLLLPNPRGRFVGPGIALLLSSLAIFGAWLYGHFGNPLPDIIGTILFALFSAGALGFGTVLVVQKNPARGAIAFAFVILSTCGLFLLLAAPFLMAATVIIYAGAIIVTFLFVLMLSHAEGPSDENDRSREPLSGAFAGFAFVGLVLFTLHQTSQAATPSHLLAPVLTAEERKALGEIAAKLEEAEKQLDGDTSTHTASDERVKAFEVAFAPIKYDLYGVVGTSDKDKLAAVRLGSLPTRLEKTAKSGTDSAVLFREDQQARDVLRRAEIVREQTAQLNKNVSRIFQREKPDVDSAKAEVRKLRDEVVLLRGAGDLPASNVRGLGFVLYSEHLLAIELAGTLLLVAVIGAVAITHRKGVAK